MALAIVFNNITFTQKIISPLGKKPPKPSLVKEKRYEVFGFAPYWNLDKFDNVDFNVLTTLAYFGLDIDSNGNFADDQGLASIESPKAKRLFDKAHDAGSRVVVTLTQMNNPDIRSLLDSPSAQKRLIEKSTDLVRNKNLDGLNIDFEYVGNPGDGYRNKFTNFVKNITGQMHEKVPGSKVTVSVYASAVKHPKIYDIAAIGKSSDGVFMMAYDFATRTADQAIPTSPLYGHKEGKYWYDISTAVEDFLTQMPANKLILGLPWYGYNYPVNEPGVKANTQKGYYTYYWYKKRQYSRYISAPASTAQTYSLAKSVGESSKVLNGWDDLGKVGFKAYQENGTWRMIFLEDEKSLRIKYEFAKENKLLGVGMWALGFDDGRRELWTLLADEFGSKLADAR